MSKRPGQIILIIVYLIVLVDIPVKAQISRFSGELTGIVKDSISNESLPYATLQIFPVSGDEKSQGTITDGTGQFKVRHLCPGKYKVKTSYMGYQVKEEIIDVPGKNLFLEILLAANTISLAGIEVTGERKLIGGTLEKTVVHVSQNITLSAGTALEALKTAPSVDVDFDGTIRYRGSDKVLVLVNGEKSGLVQSLSQIPSGAVEKIEIISNPSARNDAEGMGGIINIILKSSQEKSNHTTLELNIGDCNLYGGIMGYSHRLDNIQFSLHTGVTHKLENQIKRHLRDNYAPPPASDYSQVDTQDTRHNDGFLNASLVYKINGNNTINTSAVWSEAVHTGDREITYKTMGKNGMVEQESEKTIDILSHTNAYDVDFNYLLEFGKPGQKIKLITGYSGFSQDQDMENSHYYGLYSRLQNTQASRSDSKVKGMLEYTHPLNSDVVVNGGFSYHSQDIRNRFSSESYDDASAGWTPDEELGNQFLHIQNVNALFLEMNGSINSWMGRLGLRAEHTHSIQNGNEKKSYLSLFPSFTLSREMEEKYTFFVMYSRRINRPAINMLNPFTDNYADELNISQGNPSLKPEFVHSFEIGSRFSHPKWSGTASVFHRQIGQAISRVKRNLNDSVLMVTYVNLHNASLTGCDLNGMLLPFTGWKITFSSDFFKTSLYEKTTSHALDKSRWAWHGNINFLFRLPLEFKGLVAGYYQSKLPSVMGTYISRYYTDASISKKVLKGKGQLVFKISDVFDSYLYGLDLYAPDNNGLGYRQSNRRKINSECFTLSFTYNINGEKQSPETTKESFFLNSFEN